MSNNQLILQPDKYAYYRRHASSLPYPGQGSTAGALPNNGIQEAIYTSPVSTASKESDVAVPFYITLGSWALTFLLVICALWTASFFFEMTWSFWQYISVCALFSTIVSVIVWAWVIGDSRSLLRAEERLKMDINGRDDGNLSPPPAVDPVTIHVDIVDHMSKTSKTIHSRINIKREQLLEFAKRALLGRPLGVNANCGRGQPFSQNER
ncbi:MAG: hypothetical protein B5M51_00770 [Anaerolinea sp. 4484_236]|nr:MAG: hypothetical protein B5M51_00770 [Anaerolinea sp. 4484_236]